MKKIILLLHISMITSFGFSQCITTEDANNTVSLCKYSGAAIGKEDFSTSNIIAAAAQKWMLLMFNAVVDPAIKKTKGLRGTLSGTLEISRDDGLSPYNFQCTMLELGCTKSKKLYEKEESGVIFTFHINSLKGIAKAVTHTEYVVKKGSAEEKTVFDKIEGRQVYLLNQPTASEQYTGFTFYSKEDDGTKNIVVAKEAMPLFIPVSIKDVLLLTKGSYTVFMNGQNKTYSDFINMGVEGYLAQMDLKIFEKDFGKEATEKAKADFIKTYNDQVAGYKKMIEENPVKKWIAGIDVYLKNSSAALLKKPCIVANEIIVTDKPLSDVLFLDNPSEGMQYITINPAYADKSNPATPQFVLVQTSINAKSAVSLSAKKDFEENIDFKKLQLMLH